MILKNETDYVIPNNSGPVLTSTAVYAYRFQERRYFNYIQQMQDSMTFHTVHT